MLFHLMHQNIYKKRQIYSNKLKVRSENNKHSSSKPMFSKEQCIVSLKKKESHQKVKVYPYPTTKHVPLIGPLGTSGNSNLKISRSYPLSPRTHTHIPPPLSQISIPALAETDPQRLKTSPSSGAVHKPRDAL